MKKRSTILLISALTALVAACGSDDNNSATDAASSMPAHSMEGMDHGDGEMMDFAFGGPAAAEDATRVIEIEANDALIFSPAEVSVFVDEVVTFRVTNTGQLPHDFTLGDEAMQVAHEAEMAEMSVDEMMAMGDEPNAFVVLAGETKELTWHFSEAGQVFFGCHQVGHYAAGMKGVINIA